MPSIYIANIRIDNISFAGSISETEKLIRRRENAFVVTPNVDHIVNLQKDIEFKRIYRDADLVLLDGVPLLWASRFLKTPFIERIAGADFFPELCATAARKGYRLFFLGGRNGAAAEAKRVLEKRYKNLHVVGTYCPDFGFESDPAENKKIVEIIQRMQPDILFVGLGSPKQEKWIYRWKDQYRAPVSIGIGVSFEFVAGMVRRAPVWMRTSGLEWFWRLLMEPKKLWRRYLINDLRFFSLVLRQKIRKMNAFGK
jgi:N-acetylglucosaminyldiphosphoundecaprenol N-acetyl-beta-D-mannosaminyltransferase